MFSGELLRSLVKSVHHSIHGRHGLNHVVKGFVPERTRFSEKKRERDIAKTVRTTSSFDLPGLLGEDDEHSSLLIEDPLELLVQNHLTQLLLHLHTTSVTKT